MCVTHFFYFFSNNCFTFSRFPILTTPSPTPPSRTSRWAPRTATTRWVIATVRLNQAPSTGSRSGLTRCGTSFQKRTGRSRSRRTRTTRPSLSWPPSSRSSWSFWESSHSSSWDQGMTLHSFTFCHILFAFCHTLYALRHISLKKLRKSYVRRYL